jgi:hypothetical protein
MEPRLKNTTKPFRFLRMIWYIDVIFLSIMVGIGGQAMFAVYYPFSLYWEVLLFGLLMSGFNVYFLLAEPTTAEKPE